jgi:peptidoglycan hydrolase-like protein with peptidoglycan-binding domain
VREAQQRLAAHGFDPGGVDGVFGGKTLAATKRFQAARGLSADGIIGPKTWGALLAGQSGTTPDRPTIRRGAKGDVVRELQGILNARFPDLSKLAVDGDFGPATEKRVRHMQQAAGLGVDGICGPQTWRKLLGG